MSYFQLVHDLKCWLAAEHRDSQDKLYIKVLDRIIELEHGHRDLPVDEPGGPG